MSKKAKAVLLTDRIDALMKLMDAADGLDVEHMTIGDSAGGMFQIGADLPELAEAVKDLITGRLRREMSEMELALLDITGK